MKPAMTKAQARAWKRGWKLVNEFEREELRKTSIEVKFRQLAAMMQSAFALGWDTSAPAELKAIRAMWVRLKKAHRDAR
ncbi:hypothetical protein RAS1_05640 [Phycisphaerae bacterium RAS1]|nr:hypothetical protein RAS1_05640 [Phycisphaerae bacterium RAS1]